jgi:hypothetical protein
MSLDLFRRRSPDNESLAKPKTLEEEAKKTLEKPIALEKGLILTPQDVERKLSREEIGTAKKSAEFKDGAGGVGYVIDKDSQHVVVFHKNNLDPDKRQNNLDINSLYEGYLLKEDSPLLEQ